MPDNDMTTESVDARQKILVVDDEASIRRILETRLSMIGFEIFTAADGEEAINSFNKNNPLNEYPRPQLIRESYINLNGQWDFQISQSDKFPENYYIYKAVSAPILDCEYFVNLPKWQQLAILQRTESSFR